MYFIFCYLFMMETVWARLSAGQICMQELDKLVYMNDRLMILPSLNGILRLIDRDKLGLRK